MINELIVAGISFIQPQVLVDSIGKETINGKIFVIHKVGEKETLYGISKRYGTTVESILQYNPTAGAGLEIGQILKVPYVPKQSARAVAGTLHKVGAGETLFSIAQTYGATIDEIKQWNNLSGNALSIGQEIVVKKGNNPVPVATPPMGNKGVHIVAAKETMFSISKQYGVTVQQLKDWNKLEGNEISIGQELIVSMATSVVEKPIVTPVVSEVKKDAVAIQPAVENKEQTIRISESVKNSDEITQTGLAELIEGTEGNRKYLALHRTAEVGTILKVKNEMNNREVFVRVMGKLPDTALTDKLVIKISKSAYDRLGAIDSRFRVEVTYYK
jgi:LysM repeat protein